MFFIAVASPGATDIEEYCNLDDNLLIRSSGAWACISRTVLITNVSALADLAGHLIPALNDTYDIGNESHQWRELWNPLLW